MCVSHTQWSCLSFATVPGIKAAPEHEIGDRNGLVLFPCCWEAGLGLHFLLLLFWYLVLLHRKPQQHKNQTVSPKFAFLMKLFSNKIPYLCRRMLLRAAVKAFRDVLWASHVAGVLWYHRVLPLGVQSIFIFHPGSGGAKYLGDALLSPWLLWRDRTASWWQGLTGSFPISCWVQLTVVS